MQSGTNKCVILEIAAKASVTTKRVEISSQSQCKEPCTESALPAKSPAIINEVVNAAFFIPGPSNFGPNALVSLLGKTVVGKQILERSNLGPLSKNSQRELVNIIAEYHCELGLPTTKELLRQYADAIVIQFKYESKVSFRLRFYL